MQKNIIQKIDDYIDGKITREQISEFSLEIIKSEEWDKLKPDIQETLHLLFDLHDSNTAWTPTLEQIKESRNKIVD